MSLESSGLSSANGCHAQNVRCVDDTGIKANSLDFEGWTFLISKC